MQNILRHFLLATVTSLPIAASAVTDFVGAVLYENTDFRGAAFTLLPGEGIPYLSDYSDWFWDDWNDEASSVAVWGGVTVYLYSDVNYRGEVLVLDGHAETLGQWGWNDRVSSVYVDYAAPVGWYWDATLQTWSYREGDWLFHDNGLGWLSAASYDSLWQNGWLYHNVWGWLYIDNQTGGWFISPTYGHLYHEAGSRRPEWWYSPDHGWLPYN